MCAGARDADVEQLALISEVINLYEDYGATVEALEAADRVDGDDARKDGQWTNAVGPDSLESSQGGRGAPTASQDGDLFSPELLVSDEAVQDLRERGCELIGLCYLNELDRTSFGAL